MRAGELLRGLVLTALVGSSLRTSLVLRPGRITDGILPTAGISLTAGTAWNKRLDHLPEGTLSSFSETCLNSLLAEPKQLPISPHLPK